MYNNLIEDMLLYKHKIVITVMIRLNINYNKYNKILIICYLFVTQCKNIHILSQTFKYMLIHVLLMLYSQTMCRINKQFVSPIDPFNYVTLQTDLM